VGVRISLINLLLSASAHVHQSDSQRAGSGSENTKLYDLRQSGHQYVAHGQDLRRGWKHPALSVARIVRPPVGYCCFSIVLPARFPLIDLDNKPGFGKLVNAGERGKTDMP
jgi:hypothetical protein